MANLSCRLSTRGVETCRSGVAFLNLDEPVPTLLPSGLAALLHRLGLGSPGEGSDEPDEVKPAAEAGEDFDDEVSTERKPRTGFDPKDRHARRRNPVEKKNLHRFLASNQNSPNAPEQSSQQKPLVSESKPPQEPGKHETKTGPAGAAAEADDDDPESPRRRLGRDAALDAPKQITDQEGPDYVEIMRRQEPDQEPRLKAEDPEDKPGEAYHYGQIAEDDQADPQASYEPAPLGDIHRCRGTVEDGSRCLRKPREGSSYCPEHGV